MYSVMEERFQELMAESVKFFDLGKYDDCIEALSEAIAYARMLNREDHLIKLMLKRADSYYRKGDYWRAIKHCSRLIKDLSQMEAEDRIDYHEIQAISLAQLGNYEEAIVEYNQLIEVSDPRAQFKAYAGLGLVYYHQAHFEQQPEKYNTATFYYEKALKQEGIDQRNMTMVLHNLGLVYYEKGYYQKALNRYFEALHFHIEEYLPYTFNEVAKVYLRLDNLEKASEYIDKAAILLADMQEKDHMEIARNFFVKALYYKLLHDYETAVFFCKLALNELKDREVITEMAELYKEMANQYKNIDSERSIDYLAESKLYSKMLK